MKKLYNFYRQITFPQFFIVFLVITIFAVVSAQTEIADGVRRGESADSLMPWIASFVGGYCYILMCPIIIVCCQSWSIKREHILWTVLKLILLYIPFTLAFITLMLALRQATHFAFDNGFHDFGGTWDRYIYELPKTINIYLIIVFATYMKSYYDTAYKEQLKSAKLNEELAIAKMDVLRNQLNPHFLFNTLNLISSTMYVSVDKADSIITRLGDLLRYSLTSEHKPWVKLEEEMVTMMSFLEIAVLRFGDKMVLDIQITPEANVVKIPAMLLQPLLENAVKYGIEPASESSTISLKIKLVNDQLQIRLSNSFYQNTQFINSFGIGLNNTRKRLKVLYGEDCQLRLKDPVDNVITLEILLPAKLNSDHVFNT